jgi:hypothetical protein
VPVVKPVSWGPLLTAEAIYDGKLGPGWADWGWGPHELGKGAPAKIGMSGYGGIILRHDSLGGHYGALAFRYKAPLDWPEAFLQVGLKTSQSADAELPDVPVDADSDHTLPDGWHEVRLDLRQLNPQSAPFDRIVISARSSVPSGWVFLDRVLLSKPEAGASASAAPTRNGTLRISCNAQTHPISSLIYGSAEGAWDSGTTAMRIGGNPISRFNWQIGAWNAANDWFFENAPSFDLATRLDDGLKNHAFTALTVPLLGWVAKDTTSVGFPRAKFADQRKFDPNRSQAGDGFRPDGTAVTPGPPQETSVPAPPELIGAWIRKLVDKDRARGQRAVQMYILDNEPGLWNSTHRDVHPDPVTYDELLDRTLRYATEVRNADPDGLIAGPAEWGWLGYNYSAKDVSIGKFVRPDRRAHGDIPLIPWYLSRIAAHEKATGTRILDYLDVHFYPAAALVYGQNGAVDDAGRALRIRATRALWDPDYLDESWIDEKIRLLPRLREWVRDNHPGLKISIGEWSFGGDNDISGALATAEALGRFGQQGLDAAFYWSGPNAGSSTYWAFRAYRNFDAKGARFLDESLETRGEDQVSIFGSRDPADPSHLVAIVINRDPVFQVSARVDLVGCGEPASYREFGYHAGSPNLEQLPNAAADDQTVRATLPPYSIQVIDLTLRKEDAPDQ